MDRKKVLHIFKTLPFLSSKKYMLEQRDRKCFILTVSVLLILYTCTDIHLYHLGSTDRHRYGRWQEFEPSYWHRSDWRSLCSGSLVSLLERLMYAKEKNVFVILTKWFNKCKVWEGTKVTNVILNFVKQNDVYFTSSYPIKSKNFKTKMFFFKC